MATTAAHEASDHVADRLRRGRRPVVLLVYPNDDNREMVAEYLTAHGCRTIAVAEGDRALAAARDVDIVITGIMLRGPMNGLELIDRLRHGDATERLPVIVMTTRVLREDRERALRAGCNAFLAMPCLPDEVLAVVRRLC